MSGEVIGSMDQTAEDCDIPKILALEQVVCQDTRRGPGGGLEEAIQRVVTVALCFPTRWLTQFKSVPSLSLRLLSCLMNLPLVSPEFFPPRKKEALWSQVSPVPETHPSCCLGGSYFI